MSQRELSFAEKLRHLPGNQHRLKITDAGTCLRCHGTTKAMFGWLVCLECSFRVELPASRGAKKEGEGILAGINITNFVFGSWAHCFYCGAPPDARDHVVPYSMLEPDHTSGEKRGPRAIACTECNSALSDKWFPTLEMRAFKAQGILRDKNAALLRLPDWTPQELKGMGYTLKSMIIAKQNARLYTEERLEWLDSAKSRAIWREAQEEAEMRYPENDWLNNFPERSS